MDALLINPRDEEEMNFMLEFIKRMGLKFRKLDDIEDDLLLSVMEENRKSPLITKQSMLNTIDNILNEDAEEYK